MKKTSYDIVSVGNAIVDILVYVKEDFIASLGLEKNTMVLINKEKADDMYYFLVSLRDIEGIASIRTMSGGCAANTAVGVSSLGGKAAFMGKVGEDLFGERFTHKLRARNIYFPTSPSLEGKGTGCCYVFITPDGMRTMCTYLGCSDDLTLQDIDPHTIQNGKIIFFAGYALDTEEGYISTQKAIELAHHEGKKVALTLADPYCVKRHHGRFWDLILNHVDILFANRNEINAFFDTANHATAIKEMKKICSKRNMVAALTMSGKGAVILSQDEMIESPAVKVTQVVDTTGAGSLFAGGFIYGLTHGYSLQHCAKLANAAAGEIIQTFGARPLVPLKHTLNDLLHS